MISINILYSQKVDFVSIEVDQQDRTFMASNVPTPPPPKYLKGSQGSSFSKSFPCFFWNPQSNEQ